MNLSVTGTRSYALKHTSFIVSLVIAILINSFLVFSSTRLRQQVFREHTQGVSQTDLAKQFFIGKSTVERWYQDHYHLQHQNKSYQPWPRVLGIDEYFFSKRQRFATTLCDLSRRRIFDIVKGKSASDFAPFLQALPGRERVKIACIDLSVTYRNIIKRFFPNAMIISDRSHVLRLVEHCFMKTCNSINTNIKYQRGILTMMRTWPERLSDNKKYKLAIAALYDFKEQLLALLKHKHQTARECKILIPLFWDKIKELKKETFEPLVKLGRTLYQWIDETHTTAGLWV